MELCSFTIRCFFDDRFALLDRLLKPGGWLAVMTAFQANDAAFARWSYRRDRTHVVFYRPATFHAIAARFNWRCHIPYRNVVLLQKVGC